jgi:hypothetical protein
MRVRLLHIIKDELIIKVDGVAYIATTDSNTAFKIEGIEVSYAVGDWHVKAGSSWRSVSQVLWAINVAKKLKTILDQVAKA